MYSTINGVIVFIKRMQHPSRCRLFILALAISWSTLGFPSTLAQEVTGPLGTNLTEVTDYSHQLPFTNIFLFSRSWITQCRAGVDPGCSPSRAFDTGEASNLDLDSAGWVRSLPTRGDAAIFTSVATFWDIPQDFPAGTYVVLYDGTGILEYELGARKDSALSRPGRDIVRIRPADGGILLRISSTDPTDYVRNIRMVASSDEELLSTQPFRQLFLDRLRPYKALRFMDWMRTNNSNQSSWAARPLPSDARYSTEKGVPVEVMVDLCNTTSQEPWFTMPHQVDGAYVSSFAALVKARLNERLTVYVEYSNESWNSLFSQGSYMEQQGEREWPRSSESPFTKRINWYGKRSAEVCDIWKEAFSDQPDRVVCVMASQAANSWTAAESLACPLWEKGACVSHGISALAIAPYIGDYLGQAEFQSAVSSWTNRADGGLATLFSELRSGSQLSGSPRGGALAQSLAWIEENHVIAQRNKLDLLAYEGGQHLVGVGDVSLNASLTRLFTAANRDARIGEVYADYLVGWQNRGGGLFMHFNDISEYSKFGSWGALEKTGDTRSPKYDALTRYSSRDTGAPSLPTPLSTPPAERDKTLSVRRRGPGRLVSNTSGIVCPGTCATSLLHGSSITLRALPLDGSSFVRWLGSCRSSRRTCALTMTRDRHVTAVFRRRRPS